MIWLFGISGSGKTSIGREFDGDLLDGDGFRRKNLYDLGFSDEDRDKNIERAIKYCQDFDVKTAAFITPFERHREKIKNELGATLIWCKCSFDECAKRDPKGFYRNPPKYFTGISSKFEEPKLVDIVLDTSVLTLKECVNVIRQNIK